jgi:hypothetical protein
MNGATDTFKFYLHQMTKNCSKNSFFDEVTEISAVLGAFTLLEKRTGVSYRSYPHISK